MYGGTSFYQIHVGHLQTSNADYARTVAFSQTEEVLWAGTENGFLHALTCPALERYSSLPAHPSSVLGMLPFQDGVLSVSSAGLRWHSLGGLVKLSFREAEETLVALALDPRDTKRAVVASEAGQLITVDLETGKAVSKVEGPEGAVVLRGAGRGLLAVGTTAGRLHLLDPRSGGEAAAPLELHVEGLVGLDARAGLLASCGYGRRGGQSVLESYVKVYDIRGPPRMTGSISFPAPAHLHFHPQLASTLLVASSTGMFSLADASGAVFATPHQIDTHGSQVVACDISPTGQVLAFATQVGWVFLWGSNAHCKVSSGGHVPQKPPPPAQPLVQLKESDGFGLAPRFNSPGTKLLTDKDGKWTWDLRLPPRVVPPVLQEKMEIRDFVGHVPNPYYKREMKKGEAARLAASLRNQRQRPSTTSAIGGAPPRMGERGRKPKEREEGGVPSFYRMVQIPRDPQGHAARGFQDFDYLSCNPTRFGGLENDIANCYANALIQALYFIPPVRAAFLSIKLDPRREFSLVDELALLFRMLAAPGSKICQASNMLRALRQSREAVALGLVEGHSQKHDTISIDIEVEANKDKNLRRRIQSLQRFVLEQLNREDQERNLHPHLLEGLSSLSRPTALPKQATSSESDLAAPCETAALAPPEGALPSEAAALPEQATLPATVEREDTCDTAPVPEQASVSESHASSETGKTSESESLVTPASGVDRLALPNLATTPPLETLPTLALSEEGGLSGTRPNSPGAVSASSTAPTADGADSGAAVATATTDNESAGGSPKAATPAPRITTDAESAITDTITTTDAESAKMAPSATADAESAITDATTITDAESAELVPSAASDGESGQAATPPPPPALCEPAESPGTSDCGGTHAASPSPTVPPTVPPADQQAGSAQDPKKKRKKKKKGEASEGPTSVGGAPQGASRAGGGDAGASQGKEAAGAAAEPVQATGPRGGDPGRRTIVDRVFGIHMLQRSKVLTGSKPEKLSERTAFQVELQYPGVREKGEKAGEKRPSFGDLMARSLRPDDTLRAWFDDQLQYQPLRQTRVPILLPPVLAVSCGIQELDDMQWWQPYPGPAAAEGRPWLPWVIAVQCNASDFSVTVHEAGSVAEAQQMVHDGPDCVTAVYELTGMIAMVQDSPSEDTLLRKRPGPSQKAKPAKVKEDHLVAHVKVPGSYLDSRYGVDPGSSVLPSPGQSPFPASTNPFSRVMSRTGSATAPKAQRISKQKEPPTGSVLDLLPDDLLETAEPAREVVPEGPPEPSHPLLEGLPDDLMTDLYKQEVPGVPDGAGTSPSPPPQAEGGLREDEGLADPTGGEAALGKASKKEPHPVTAPRVEEGSVTEGRAPNILHSVSGDLQLRNRGLRITPPDPGTGGEGTWLLFNDFTVTPTPAAEVLRLYGTQKIPCLLYWTEVRGEAEWNDKLGNIVTEPVLSKEELRDLVARSVNPNPNRQSGMIHVHSSTAVGRVPAGLGFAAPQDRTAGVLQARQGTSVLPFEDGELPQPGTLFGLDAEFVALSPPDKIIRGGLEVETRPSRLGLARVVVVRGTPGPLLHKPIIDDYIRMTEPVYDYLTPFSGLKPGDLEPGLSQYPLTTHKAAYMKLRALVDLGCVLVGHGLKQDFRMVNIYVPPSQVIDTVELFHFKRQRKLSLRFLAAQLLGISIQRGTHDALEDAITALRLYQVYCELRDEGRLQEKLLEMYRWGKAHGWDPAAALHKS